MHACINLDNSSQVVQDLIDYGANVNRADCNGLTALDYAVKMSSKYPSDKLHIAWEKVAYLLRADATFGPKSSYSYSYLLHIIQNANCCCNIGSKKSRFTAKKEAEELVS